MIIIQKYTGYGWEDTFHQTNKNIVTLSAIISNLACGNKPMAYRAIERIKYYRTTQGENPVQVLSFKDVEIVPPIIYAHIEKIEKTKIIW